MPSNVHCVAKSGAQLTKRPNTFNRFCHQIYFVGQSGWKKFVCLLGGLPCKKWSVLQRNAFMRRCIFKTELLCRVPRFYPRLMFSSERGCCYTLVHLPCKPNIEVGPVVNWLREEQVFWWAQVVCQTVLRSGTSEIWFHVFCPCVQLKLNV